MDFRYTDVCLSIYSQRKSLLAAQGSCNLLEFSDLCDVGGFP